MSHKTENVVYLYKILCHINWTTVSSYDIKVSLSWISGSGPSFLYKCYMGDLSINAMWDWLGEHKDLQNLVKKAFR